MTARECPEPPALSQGRYAYAIAITRIGPGGGYEWKVIRTQDAGIARRGAAPEIPALVCHGTAKTCDEAQRKSLAARRTIMGQRREADAPR